ncbi:hypothetical protein DRE_04289 [Drechslerella stenobrocha 248]|uniref:Helicase ATP-binding domain-containing protein n=1 Tax=Drechslerella stenobrocha 248 TaxID=1043628 RepID=W7HRB5_9PEZI|nr:hypothetical protein DRE_04289 [Drechslerella stenobrocha 248]
MVRKGDTAKRYQSSDDEDAAPDAETRVTEPTAASSRPRRTRSGVSLNLVSEPTREQAQRAKDSLEAQVWQARPDAQFLESVSIPSREADGSGQGIKAAAVVTSLLQPISGPTNSSSLVPGRAAKSNLPVNTKENVPLGKRKREHAEPKPVQTDVSEFETPLPSNNEDSEFGMPLSSDDDESNQEDRMITEADSDAYSDAPEPQRPVQSKSKLKQLPPAGRKSIADIFKQTTKNFKNLNVSPKSQKQVKNAPAIKCAPQNKWTPDTINELPPLSSIQEIFFDLTKNNERLKQVATRLNGRPLRIATMCSGTESPLLALGLITTHMKSLFNAEMAIEHVFSCEIEPWKQAYIERNFQPPILFRDVCELGEDFATTAYGAKVRVPGNCDLLVAGTSCVDYSSLNNFGKGLNDGGESGRTFWGMFRWVQKHRPKIVILENVCKAPWGQVVSEFESIGYAAGHTRFDTKNYYIPHTRQRGYLVAFDSIDFDLPTEWVQLTNSLTRPASVSFESFLLEPDDPRVLQARQKLTREEVVKAKAHEWTACEIRHTNARTSENLGRQRPLTDWQENGGIKYPDFTWQEWGAMQVDRVNDLLDISYLRNSKKGMDISYKARLWNLSQNVDRDTEGKSAGISQCLTPTMIPYLTARGGPMIGLELLSLQGIPVEQLLLTRETEANLKDLAGNAMSSTVIGTAIIAALITGNKLFESPTVRELLSGIKIRFPKKPLIALPRRQAFSKLDLSGSTQLRVNDLLKAAMRSSRMCICEGRSLISTSPPQICTVCGHRSCTKCGGKPAHVYHIHQSLSRMPPNVFEDALKEMLPMIVTFQDGEAAVMSSIQYVESLPVKQKDWTIWREYVCKALSSSLAFKTIKRRDIWMVEYESPSARLDLLLDPTRVEWRLYVKIDTKSTQWKQLRRLFDSPVAQMFVKNSAGSLLQGSWRIGVPGIAFVGVNIEGEGELIDSWQKSIGIVEPALAGKMVHSKLCITLADPAQATLLDLDITGSWELLPKCGTASRALHRKVCENGDLIFLFLDPNRLGDNKDDSFVISQNCERVAFGEHRLLISKFDATFRPSGDLKVIQTQVTVSTFWAATGLQLMPSETSTARYSYSSTSEIASHTNCDVPAAFLVCSAPLSLGLSNVLAADWRIIDDAHAEETFSSINWLIKRVKPSDTEGGWLPYGLQGNESSCTSCAPPKPKIIWNTGRDKSRPVEDPEESAVWERAMKSRPSPWVTALKIDGENTLHLHVGLNLVSLCHRAADLLPPGIGMGDLSVSWQLISDYVDPPRLLLPEFEVRSNRPDAESPQPPGFVLDLRKEQLRSLSWMRGQESDSALHFLEEEIVEALHSQLSWKAAVKASRPNGARGGVLADAVGYGKTAIILGLLAHAKDSYVQPSNPCGRIPLKATLVIVPGHLSNQWESEIRKFTGSLFKVINIKTVNNLISCSIKTMMEADVVIVAASLFKSNAYLQRLAEFSGGTTCPTIGGRRLQDWLQDSNSGLKIQVENLQSGKLAEAVEVITKGCEQRRDTRIAEKEGTLLAGRKASNRAEAAKDGSSSKYQTSDTEDYDDEPVRKKTKAAASEKEPMIYDERRWKLKASKTDWRNMISPPLELFYFNRLVLDEFTYCSGMPFEVIPNLLSTYRWVLSGTPPLGDFADIKKIARFLGILLGVDDDTANSDLNNKRIAKERSAVESFQAFRELRTAAWHQDRHTHAQKFLDQFMRQNIAETDEIPWEGHFLKVILPASERAVYIELDHHLKALDMNVTRRSHSKSGGDREARLHVAIGESSSAEEALIKTCSHFSINIGGLSDGATAFNACDAIVEGRLKQLGDNQRELTTYLRDGLLISRRASRDVALNCESAFVRYVEEKRKHRLDDEEATKIFRELLEAAKGWANAHAQMPTVPTILASLKPARVRGGDEDDEDADDASGGPTMDSAALLKTIQWQVSRLLKELVGRCRSLRFFQVVREAQGIPGGQTAHIWRDGTCICGKRGLDRSQIMVSSSCGHSACAECMVTAAGLRSECPRKAEGCQSRVPDASLIKVTSLGTDADAITTHGAKLDALVGLLKTRIPADERVLVFIQFPDLLKKVEQVLREAGITTARLAGSSRAKASDLALFQSNSSTRVLLLEVMGETAAGANLTVANHVVFLSPLLAVNDQQYQAAETQAIGRARRYGQKKTVHIWRLVAEGTIDYAIYAERGNPVPNLP